MKKGEINHQTPKSQKSRVTSFIAKLKIPAISGTPSRKEWEIEAWRIFVKSLANIQSAERLMNLLSIATTRLERRRVLLRIATLNRLMKKISYKRISDELWVTKQTISSLKKGLEESEYVSYWIRPKAAPKVRANKNAPKFRDADWHRGRPHKTKYGTVWV